MPQQPATPNSAAFAFGIHQSFAVIEPVERVFPRHYLLYASSGVFQLEVADAQWFLPPQRAAWIAAYVPIRVTVSAPAVCSSVLYSVESIEPPVVNCRVFSVSQLAREMILYSMRWGADRDPGDQTANAFFLSLAAVCSELGAIPGQFWLPRARSAELRRALAYTLDTLSETCSFGAAAAAAGVSERTLARRCADELGMTWRQFVRRARMLHAMELLATPGAKVVETAYATGFESLSAFNSAFRNFTGTTPSQYRQHILPH